ncbi:MAG: hypothetical protein B6242_12100 [Anaerolineaceae bacterium 4572_78]|nr:MAG: hypothetical protein B6242_12100 [Anaerolineaceae bacterium 4572_78]
MQEVKNINAEEFNTRTRSHLYKQWQRFTAAQHSAYRIGIWGTTGAGKTTYLSMLYDSLLLRPGWTVAADTNARKFVTSQLRTIRTKGHFPPPTELTTEAEIFRYVLQEERSQHVDSEFNQITLDFVDAPGEFYEKPHQADRRVAGEIDILDYLSSCHGIIFLLDPDRLDNTLDEEEDDYRTMLLDLFLEFQERNVKSGFSDDLRLEQYLAFCVTKADKDPFWTERENPQNAVEEIMGDTMYRMLSSNFARPNRYKFFSISAIGRYQDTETGEWLENVSYPGRPTPTRHVPKKPNDIIIPAVTTTNIGTAYEPSEPTPPVEPFSETTVRPPQKSTWVPTSSSEKSERAKYVEQVSIIKKRAINPLNVIEPLDWLVDSMRRQPPRITPRSKR